VLAFENIGLLKENGDWFVFSGDFSSTSGVLNGDDVVVVVVVVANESDRDSFGLFIVIG
jgi:hypothetical protein